MKPHETSGVVFENLPEIEAASRAFAFAAGLNRFPEKTQAELELVAQEVQSQHEELKALACLQSNPPDCSLSIQRIGAEHLTKRALELTTSLHPDELLRTAARGMLASYQEAQGAQ